MKIVHKEIKKLREFLVGDDFAVFDGEADTIVAYVEDMMFRVIRKLKTKCQICEQFPYSMHDCIEYLNSNLNK